MKLERVTVLRSGLSGVAIALGLLLAGSGCSDSSNDEAESSSTTASEPEVKSAPEGDRAPEAIGKWSSTDNPIR